MIHILDTGPLVGALNRNDAHHAWATALLAQLPIPLRVCEPVLTEAAYFLREDGVGAEPLFALLERRAIVIDFNLADHWPRLRTLMTRYQQMDLADACVVAMSERAPRCRVLTVDRRDFTTYRRNDRQVIDFIAPPRA